MAKSRSTASATPSWKSKQPSAAKKAPAAGRAVAARMPIGRKGGGYRSDQTMDFNKSQSIEELTGGRIKKKA